MKIIATLLITFSFCLIAWQEITTKQLDKIQIDKECSLVVTDSMGLKVFRLESQYSKYIIGFSNVDYVKTVKGRGVFIVENSIYGSTFEAKKDLIIWNNGIEWNFFLNPIIIPTYKLNSNTQVKDEKSGIVYTFKNGSLIPRSRI